MTEEDMVQAALKLLHRNLAEIRAQKATFVDPRQVHPDLKKAEAETIKEIARIEEENFRQVIGDSKLTEIVIPIIIVAMNFSQADGLFNHLVFAEDKEGEEQKAKFIGFMEAIKPLDINELKVNYRETPSDWSPYLGFEVSAKEIILSMIKGIRDSSKSPVIVRPDFCSTNFFSEDDSTRHATWMELRDSACLILIDGVSLFCPAIYKALEQSGITSNPLAATLIISPVNFYGVKANWLLEQELRARLELAHARFDKYLDRLCEIGAGDIRSLQRWLYSVLPETVINIQSRGPNLRKLESLRQIIGPVPEVGDKIFYGGRRPE